jgi:ferredoxin
MNEADIRFERENLEGLIPVGTYLSNAAGRFGIRFKEECRPEEGLHGCEVEVTKGADLLSEPTAAETKYFEEHGPRGDRRLACQAKIERSGEITIMTMAGETTDNTKDEEQDKKADDYRKEFAELPLEKKIASLVQLEAIAFSETVSFVVNSPYMVFDKVLDVLAEFGFRKEQHEKAASRPSEHAEGNGDEPATPPDEASAPEGEAKA